MVNIQNTTLFISAGTPSQFPSDGLPQIALSGRSNVGKSSLVNTLLGRKALARVSSSPGKTVTINFYSVDKKFYIADLPGYGYARRSGEEQKKFAGLADTYFKMGAPALVVQLVDLKAGATADDRTMFDFLNRSGLSYIVAATKCDKLNKTDRAKNLEKLENDPLLNPPHAKEKITIIPFSSLNGEGRDALLAELIGAAER